MSGSVTKGIGYVVSHVVATTKNVTPDNMIIL